MSRVGKHVGWVGGCILGGVVCMSSGFVAVCVAHLVGRVAVCAAHLDLVGLCYSLSAQLVGLCCSLSALVGGGVLSAALCSSRR